jgi:segregation and condensation protein A
MMQQTKLRDIKLQQFEGPLDLLLQLIETEKLDITTVALAEVTEQYIKILQASGNAIRAEELTDFLVVAARLLLIKSRALLPFLKWEDEESGEELTAQLRMYREYVEAMKAIQKMLSKNNISFAREKLLTVDAPRFQPPETLTAKVLANVFEAIIRGVQPQLNLPTEIVRKTISIEQKINEIRERVFSAATTRFSEVLASAKDRTDVIVSFLALLELMKQRIITVSQDDNFSDILIERI